MPTTTSPLTTPRSGFVQPAFRLFMVLTDNKWESGREWRSREGLSNSAKLSATFLGIAF